MPDDDSHLGLRERKKLETRRALLKAAVRLAYERGLEHVTVDDIAAEAGVSARTFFNYFASKEDAVLQPDDDPLEQMRQFAKGLVDAPAELSPLHAFAHVMRPFAERVDNEAEEWLARVSIIERDPSLIARMFTGQAETDRITIEAIAARLGTSPDDFYPRLLLQVVSSAFHGVVRHWYALNGEASVARLFDTAIEAIAAGLPVPPGTAGTEGNS
ncbi:MAG: TetR family transcriptional regulator [Kibdelosporangium sp.]